MLRVHPLLAVMLLVAAAVSWWLVELTPSPALPAPPRGEREVDHYVTGLDAVHMTPAGRPAHRLRAARLEHYVGDDTTEMHRPAFTIFQEDAPPWEIDADTAWVSSDGSLVLLSGEVRIDRRGTATVRPMRLRTRELRVKPREGYAETDERVRVDSDADWLEAQGMQAWLRPPSRIKFLSQVRGHHVPR